MLAFRLRGRGSIRLLLMHNWFGDASTYDKILSDFDQDLFSLVLVDLRGYGESKSFKGNYSVEEACSDVFFIADHLGWDAFHLIGHSMSGMVAQKMVVMQPERIQSVIAITPVPACGTPKPPELMAYLEAAARDNDDHAIACANLLTSHRYPKDFSVNMVHRWRAHSSPEARMGYLHMFSNTDFSSQVEGITTPMLVLFGIYDWPGEEELMRNTFLKWYPNAILRALDSGHFPMLEVPHALSLEIKAFLQKIG